MPPHSACHVILNKHSAQSSKLNHFVDVAPLAGGTLVADEQEMEEVKTAVCLVSDLLTFFKSH